MVYSHWGLRESPFQHGLDPRFFFESTGHEEALARLHFLADQSRRVGLLLGDSGIGKSLLLEVFARQKRTPVRQVAYMSLLGMTPNDFLWHLAVRLGRDPDPADSMFLLWRTVSDHLVENRYQHIGTVLLFDDADEAHDEVLMQVARVAQLDPSTNARLTLVLAAQSRRIAQLGVRLLELADLRVDLEPWQQAETAKYLTWALAQAGRTAPTFTADAVRHLHELADGVPRRVKQLADMALVAGAGGELEVIDLDTIEAVYHELGVAVNTRL